MRLMSWWQVRLPDLAFTLHAVQHISLYMCLSVAVSRYIQVLVEISTEI